MPLHSKGICPLASASLDEFASASSEHSDLAEAKKIAKFRSMEINKTNYIRTADFNQIIHFHIGPHNEEEHAQEARSGHPAPESGSQ